MSHMVLAEAKRQKRKIGVLFVDWEAQYQLTITHVQEMFDLYKEWIDPYWVALPLTTTNACSMFEPEWQCWDPAKKDLWVRDIPPQAISDESFFPFYHHGMTFEEFVPAFGEWYGQGKLTACFVGIRTAESLNRWRTIAREKKQRFEGYDWTTRIIESTYNIYPMYDWQAEDLWTFHGKTKLPYNRLYDRMHQAGLSVHQMRICEPYGDEQRKGLWLFHVIEPETWRKVVERVAGANTGSRYANESGAILGNRVITKPEGHTWKSYAEMLLNSMPTPTAEHYRNKISVWIRWYHIKGNREEIPDELPGDLGPKDKPSWRRVCKVLLKNDYWCKTLCFSPTKTAAFEKYQKLMKKRRAAWGIYS